MTEHASFMCPRCQIGRCQPGQTTYVRLLEGQLLRVPKMLAYTCDVCGYHEYDPESMMRLEALVGQLDVPMEEDTQSVAKAPTVDTIDDTKVEPTRRAKP